MLCVKKDMNYLPPTLSVLLLDVRVHTELMDVAHISLLPGN